MLGTTAFGQKTLQDAGKDGKMVYDYAYSNAKLINPQVNSTILNQLSNSKGAKPELINYLKSTQNLKLFTGFEFMQFAKVVIDYSDLKNGNPNFDSDDFAQYLLGDDYKQFTEGSTTNKGFWGAIWGGIKSAVQWIFNHMDEIEEGYEWCVRLKIC